ncbi:MAG: zf-HC2 domain-containing protein [Myxococcota bacterium]
MTCAERRAALVAYLDEELGPAERAELETHLAGCEACQAALAAERRLTVALASLPAVEPPRDFEARFWARLAREGEGGGARVARERDPPASFFERLFSRRFALSLGGAAAAAVALVLALRVPSEPDVDLQIVANGEDLELLEDPDLELIEVVDVLEEWDGDQG